MAPKSSTKEDWVFIRGKWKHKKEPVVFTKYLGYPMPQSMKFKEMFEKYLPESIKMFDWDGALMDDCSTAINSNSKVKSNFFCTWDGKAISNKNPGEVAVEYLSPVNRAVKKIKPRFCFLLNGAQGFWGANCFGKPSPLTFDKAQDIYNSIKLHYRNSNWDVMREKKLITCMLLETGGLGGVHFRKHPFTYRRFSIFLRSIKESVQLPIILISHIFHPDRKETSLTNVKLMSALLFANGIGFFEHHAMYGGYVLGERNDPYNKSFLQYLKFAIRYEKYMYDLDIKWNLDAKVKSEEPAVLCQELIFTKKNGNDEKEMYIHFLNRPEKRLLTGGGHIPPRPLKDLKVTAQWPWSEPPGKLEIYYLSPDFEKQTQKIDFSIEGKTLSFKLPELKFWGFVVIKTSCIKKADKISNSSAR